LQVGKKRGGEQGTLHHYPVEKRGARTKSSREENFCEKGLGEIKCRGERGFKAKKQFLGALFSGRKGQTRQNFCRERLGGDKDRVEVRHEIAQPQASRVGIIRGGEGSPNYGARTIYLLEMTRAKAGLSACKGGGIYSPPKKEEGEAWVREGHFA